LSIDKKQLLLSFPYKITSLFITSAFVIITVLHLFNKDVAVSLDTYLGSIYIGMFFGVILGIPFSYLIEGMLFLLKVKNNKIYIILHVVLHTLAGSFLPIIGNIYALSTSLLYLLLKSQKYKIFLIVIIVSILCTIAVLISQ
jgi:hypothetical protein